MTWFRVDDGFTEHPKLESLEGDPRLWAEALAVWLAAGCYCNRNLTDGRISRARLARLTPMGARAVKVGDELVRAGLWLTDGAEFVFHDWLQYQTSAAEVQRKRDEGAERQRRSRDRRRVTDTDVTDDVTRDGVSDSHRDDSVSHSDPSHPIPSVSVILIGSDSAEREIGASAINDAFEGGYGRPLGKWAPRYSELQPFSPYELKCAWLAMERTCRDSGSRPNPGLYLSKLEEVRRSPPKRQQRVARTDDGKTYGYHPGSTTHEVGDVQL